MLVENEKQSNLNDEERNCHLVATLVPEFESAGYICVAISRAVFTLHGGCAEMLQIFSPNSKPEKDKDTENMGKSRKKQAAQSVPNKQIHNRVSYLYQAATFLATTDNATRSPVGERYESCHNRSSGRYNVEIDATQQEKFQAYPAPNGSRGAQNSDQSTFLMTDERHFISNLRLVAQKSQIRLNPALKRSFCKTCDSLLVPGTTSRVQCENKSKNGRKPQADVHVITCMTCGAQKKFPMGAKRQSSKAQRLQQSCKPGASRRDQPYLAGGAEDR